MDKIAALAYAAFLASVAGTLALLAYRRGFFEKLGALPDQQIFGWRLNTLLPTGMMAVLAVFAGYYHASRGAWREAILLPVFLYGIAAVIALAMIGEATALASLKRTIVKRGGLSRRSVFVILVVGWSLCAALVSARALQSSSPAIVMAVFAVPSLVFLVWVAIVLRRR